ncbi:MAG: hypothetical protein LBF67_06735 [Prevotellaceae bacterium]|nr:hypothetical protein [Prevotellaceae bacterium]
MLEGTTPIETPKHSFKNFDQARKWAYEHIVGAHKNDATEEYMIVSKKAIKKYTSASAALKSVDKDAHLSTLKALPQIIKTALLKEQHADKKDNQDIKEIQRFYGAISYEGKKHPVKITVIATKNEGNKAYSYEVLDIENPGIGPGNLQNGQQNVSDNSSKAFSHSEFSTGNEQMLRKTGEFMPNNGPAPTSETTSAFPESKGTNISETSKQNPKNSTIVCPPANMQLLP